MRALFVGSTGYLAKAAIKEFTREGHEVFEVRRTRSATEESTSNVIVFADASSIRSIILELKPDIVVNMANRFARDEEVATLREYSEVNSELVAEICMGCVEADSSLLQVGSAWQSSLSSNSPQNENVYALFRGIARAIVRWFVVERGLRASTLNLFDTYGPLDNRGKVIEFISSKLGTAETIELSGGKQLLELVHVDDVARAILRSAENVISLATSANEEFWCYPNEAVTLRAVVDAIEKASQSKVLIAWGARPYRVGEKFEREIAGKPTPPRWKQEILLESGMKSLFQTSEPT